MWRGRAQKQLFEILWNRLRSTAGARPAVSIANTAQRWGRVRRLGGKHETQKRMGVQMLGMGRHGQQKTERGQPSNSIHDMAGVTKSLAKSNT